MREKVMLLQQAECASLTTRSKSQLNQRGHGVSKCASHELKTSTQKSVPPSADGEQLSVKDVLQVKDVNQMTETRAHLCAGWLFLIVCSSASSAEPLRRRIPAAPVGVRSEERARE